MPGHGACPGCGVFPALDQFLRGIEGDVVVLYQTGCAMVVTTGYPYTSHRITYVHNLFQNGAATLSGLVEMFHERVRRGELPAGEDITFVMVTGDGGMDIGMGAAIGAALRNHGMIVVEYDNQGYMNTGQPAELLDAAGAPDLDQPRRAGRDSARPSTTRTPRRSWRRPTSRTCSPASRASPTTWWPRPPRRSGTPSIKAPPTARCSSPAR